MLTLSAIQIVVKDFWVAVLLLVRSAFGKDIIFITVIASILSWTCRVMYILEVECRVN